MCGEGGQDQTGLRLGVAQVVQKQDAAVSSHVAVNQCADVMVLCDEASSFPGRLSQQGFIARIRRSLADIDHVVACLSHRAHGQRHDVGVRKDAQAIRRRW